MHAKNMIPGSKHLNRLGVGMTCLTLFAGVVLWDQLPMKMAIHFSATGTAGSYVPKTVGIVLIPIFMLFVLVSTQAATRIDPPDDERTYIVAVVGTLLLLAVVQFLVLGWNLGYHISFTAVLGGIIAWGAVIVLYSLWRTRTMRSR